MKKQLIIIGIIVLLVCVGLSGCQIQSCSDPGDNKPIAVGCILQNPDKYLNKSVIIKGTYTRNDEFNRSMVTTSSIHYANVPDGLNLIFLEDVNTSMLKSGKEYSFTGIIKEFEIRDYNYQLHPFYLEVTKIETV